MQEMTHEERSSQECNVCCEKQDRAGNAKLYESAEHPQAVFAWVKTVANRALLTRACSLQRSGCTSGEFDETGKEQRALGRDDGWKGWGNQSRLGEYTQTNCSEL